MFYPCVQILGSHWNALSNALRANSRTISPFKLNLSLQSISSSSTARIQNDNKNDKENDNVCGFRGHLPIHSRFSKGHHINRSYCWDSIITDLCCKSSWGHSATQLLVSMPGRVCTAMCARTCAANEHACTYKGAHTHVHTRSA